MNQHTKKIVPDSDGKLAPHPHKVWIFTNDDKAILQFFGFDHLSKMESTDKLNRSIVHAEGNKVLVDYGYGLTFTAAECRRMAYLFEQAADKLDDLIRQSNG